MNRERLDARTKFSSAFEKYNERYGWSFSKALCEHAVSRMRDRNGKKVDFIDKEKVGAQLKQYGIELKNDAGYDAAYVWCLAKTNCVGTSLPNEQYLALFVRDYLDGPDGYPGKALTRYMADCIGKGETIIWEDVL